MTNTEYQNIVLQLTLGFKSQVSQHMDTFTEIINYEAQGYHNRNYDPC